MSNSTECFFWPNQPNRCHVVKALQYLCGSISFICLLCLILAIVAFKLYRMFVQRLILYMCICSLINTSMFFARVSSISHTSCIIQGFLNQFTAWAELLWICVITANIVLVYHGYQPDKYERKFHMLVWGLSTFWSVIPLFGMRYGAAGSWCWIKREYTALRFGVWYVPLMLIIMAQFIVCIHLACAVSSDVHMTDETFFQMEQSRALQKKEVKPLLAYPIIYFFLNIPLLIYRIDDAIRPDDLPDYTLLVLSVITFPLLGTFNAVAFCIIEDTLKDSCNLAAIKNILCCEEESSRVLHNYEVVDGSGEIPTTSSMTRNAGYSAVA